MLLDTCALLWIAGGRGELSGAALEQIEKSPDIYIMESPLFRKLYW